MKLFSLLILLGISLVSSPLNAQVIHVLYGDLKPGQQKILDRVFKPRLEDLKGLEQVSKVIQKPKATYLDLLEALRSPESIGVIFLGHPAIKTKGVFPDKKIIHGYLMDADGRYLPKKILSGANPQLKFLSIMTCHESAVLPLYLESLPEHVKYYKSPTHHIDGLANPLYEFTSFYSTPEILDQVLNDFNKKKYDDFKLLSNPKIGTLKISTKDLVSSRFSYGVVLNDRFIGALYAQKTKRGRLLNSSTYLIDIFKSDLSDTENNLRIFPDDSDRPKPQGLKVVDDILLENISLNNQSIPFRGPVHLGDQEFSPDMNEGLGFLKNKEDFINSPFQSIWEGTW
jgi:hypothetical protein